MLRDSYLIPKRRGLGEPTFFDSCEGFLQIYFFFACLVDGDSQTVNLLRGKERPSPLYRGFQKSLAMKLL